MAWVLTAALVRTRNLISLQHIMYIQHDWRRAVIAAVAVLPIIPPAQAYDLQYRQNGVNLSQQQLRTIFSAALPVDYDRNFPDQQWTTYLLVDAHPSKQLVAITLDLSPRIGRTKAVLPIATYSVIEPLPGSLPQWQQLLGAAAQQYANQMLTNRNRILNGR